jgi:hypothetical protein
VAANIFILIVSLLIAAMFHVLLSRVDSTDPDSFLVGTRLSVTLSLMVLMFVAGLTGIVLSPMSHRWKFPVMMGYIGVFQSLWVGALLQPTPFSLYAYYGDASFIAASIVKYMTFHGFVDFSYRDLPAFYPPLYFWVVGKLAVLLGIDPISAPKFGMLFTMVLYPFFIFWLWSRIEDVWTAAAMVLVLTIVGSVFQKPYTVISMTLFLPWWLHYVEGIGAHPETDRQKLRHVLGGGLIGGLLFMTYYYPFFIGGLSLMLTPFIERILGIRREDKLPFRIKIQVLSVAAVFSSFYWFPYLASLVAVGGGESLQNRWFSPGTETIPVPFNLSPFPSFIGLIGFVYLVVFGRKDSIASALIGLLIAAYTWFALGLLGVLLDVGLLLRIATQVIGYFWFYTGIIGIAAFIKTRPEKEYLLYVAGIAGVLLLLVPSQIRGLREHDALKYALELQRYDALATVPAWLVSNLEHPAQDVILSASQASAVIAPVHFFVTSNAYYSHPAGLHSDRLAFLERIAQQSDPKLVATALRNNRYDSVDVVFAHLQDGNLRFQFSVDNFPDGSTGKDIFIPNALFAEPYFVAITNPFDGDNHRLYRVDPATVPIERTQIDTPEQLTYSQLILLSRLYATFEEHIALDFAERQQEVEDLMYNRRQEVTSLSTEDMEALSELIKAWTPERQSLITQSLEEAGYSVQ